MSSNIAHPSFSTSAPSSPVFPVHRLLSGPLALTSTQLNSSPQQGSAVSRHVRRSDILKRANQIQDLRTNFRKVPSVKWDQAPHSSDLLRSGRTFGEILGTTLILSAFSRCFWKLGIYETYERCRSAPNRPCRLMGNLVDGKQ